MPQRPFDGGDAAAILVAFFGFRPDELDDLTDEQRELFLSRFGLVRYYRDLPFLQSQFAKIDDEGIEKIIAGGTDPKAARRALAWELFALRPYGLLDSEPSGPESAAPLLTISPECAEGIVSWWETGKMSALPDAPVIWREHLQPIHRQLIARAAQMQPRSDSE
jgi:hypothetical protein